MAKKVDESSKVDKSSDPAALLAHIRDLESRITKLETLTTLHTKSLADRGDKKPVVKAQPTYKLWRINKMRLREVSNKQKKYGALVPGAIVGWFIARGLTAVKHGRAGALLGLLLTQFFGGLPGEPGRTIRKVGGPVALISMDVDEFYKRMRFIYETGGVSYKTWQSFDQFNQKTGLLPRIGAFQHWRLRFIKSEKEYKEVMEERESARLEFVAFLNNVALDRQKNKEEREAKRRERLAKREADPNIRVRPVRWWKRFRGVQDTVDDLPLPDTPSAENAAEVLIDVEPESTTDKLLGRVMWGEDPDPYVSEMAKNRVESSREKKKGGKSNKKTAKRKKDDNPPLFSRFLSRRRD